MPPAAYTTLREVFLTRVIRIKAVQDEHAAAIEESRQPGTPVPEDIVELLFDYGFIPGRDKHSSLWPISTTGLGKLPPKLTPALKRGLLAAECAWHQFVRELRNGALIATGERFKREPWRDADRQEIGLETWLPDPRHLQFDVRTNTVCFVEGDGVSNRTVPVWFEIRVRRADEVAETTEREHALFCAPGADDTASSGRAKGAPTRRQQAALAALKKTFPGRTTQDLLNLPDKDLEKAVAAADGRPLKRDAIRRTLKDFPLD